MSCPDESAASDALNAFVAGPAKVTSDAGSVESHPLPDLIAADQYLAAKCAAKKRNKGVRFNQLSPGGTVGAGIRPRNFDPYGRW